jgi:tetratricopeptide (TPR) repeat protein
MHFGDWKSLRYLLVGIVVGSLCLVPFCLYEIRMSPMLLDKVYGLGRFQSMRLGGYRPRVFFTGGLELGMWMTVSSLAGTWLFKCGALTRLGPYRFGAFILPILLGITIMCRSSGALLLLMTGLSILWISSRFNRRLPMMLLLSCPLLYVTVRTSNQWDYRGLITFLRNNFSEARAESLEFRFRNEDVLIVKAVEKPLFGWGGWGRSRIHDKRGRDISKTDGLWIIEFGSKGMLGLGSWLAAFLLPAVAFVRRHQPKRWIEPAIGGQAAVAGILGIYTIDCLLNAQINAVYIVLLGSLVTSLQLGRYYDAGEEAASRKGLPKTAAQASEDEVRLQFAASARLPAVRLADRYIEAARKSKPTDSDASALFAWRHALSLLVSQNQGDPDEAYLARRRFDCANDLAWFLLSRSQAEPDELAEAVSLASQAVHADPENPTYWNTLASALCRSGDDQAAIESIDRGLALAMGPTGFDFAVLALSHARLGQRDEAARHLAEAQAWRERNRTQSPLLDALIEGARTVLAT